MAGVVLVACAGGQPVRASGDVDPPPPSVLLITIDTLRPDALGWVGGGDWTPQLDALAREGVRFPAAVAPAPLTLPSHASLFSALVPRRHGVHDNGRMLGAGVPLLAERLSAAGWDTAAFVSGYPLSGSFGLRRGFGHYDDRLTAGDGAWLERPARETNGAARAWISEATEPWFAWVHYYDPHFPYEPPDELRRPGRRGAYDGEVAAVDRALGELLTTARSAATRTGLLTVATADHGESLGEHGEGTHGFFVYDSTVLVPMVWHLPGRLTAAERAEPARLVDVAPTVLELLGLPPLEGVDGVSLVPLLEGRPQPLPPAYVETFQPWISYGWAPLTAVRHDGFKLIAAPRPELYDLRADPEETRNVVATERRRARELRRLHAEAEASPPAASAETVGDPEVARRLAALGYVGSAGAPAAPPPGLADPKDRLALRETLTEADRRVRGGDLQGALERFDRVLAEEPRNRFALSRSGEALLTAGALAPAIERLRLASRLDPDQPEVRRLLGTALTRAGLLDEALDQWLELVRLQPWNPVAWSNLGATLGRSGRSADAVAAMEKAATLAPGDPDRLIRLAFAEVDARRISDAVRHLAEAAEVSGEAFEHAGTLGLLLEQTERAAEATQWLERSRPGQPDFAQARLTLARRRASAGDPTGARVALAEALAVDPGLAAVASADELLASLMP